MKSPEEKAAHAQYMKEYRINNLERMLAIERRHCRSRAGRRNLARRDATWFHYCEKLRDLMVAEHATWQQLVIARAIYKREAKRFNSQDQNRKLRSTPKGRAILKARHDAWKAKPGSKAKLRAIDKRKYRKNPEPKKAQANAWRKAHPIERCAHQHKRRAAEGSYTREDIDSIRCEQDGCCYYCGLALKKGHTHVDHMIPITRGGTNWADNVCLACDACNFAKGTLTADEFLLERSKVAA